MARFLRGHCTKEPGYLHNAEAEGNSESDLAPYSHLKLPDHRQGHNDDEEINNHVDDACREDIFRVATTCPRCQWLPTLRDWPAESKGIDSKSYAEAYNKAECCISGVAKARVVSEYAEIEIYD